MFAGAAIGVSHLVQSTRAGGVFGLGLLLPVALILFLKFPSFAVGTLYTAKTGESLLHAYKKKSIYFMWLFGALTFMPAIIVIAAVTLVTAALFIAVSGLNLSPPVVSLVLLVVCGLLLQWGGYKRLDRGMKLVFAVMTISTVVATCLAAQSIEWNWELWFPGHLFDFEHFVFLMALLGFMPAPIDIAVLQSYWTKEKLKGSFAEGGDKNSSEQQIADAWFDFKVGYWVTGLLAFCFMLLGTSLFYQGDIELSSKAIPFSKQIIAAYTNQLGDWSFALVGVCTFTVMFSTTLSVLDGFPRVFSGWIKETFDKADASNARYTASLWVMVLFASLLLFLFMADFKKFIDLATITTALVSPFLAMLNHMVLFGSDSVVPKEYRPRWMEWTSLTGIVVLLFLSIAFVWVR